MPGQMTSQLKNLYMVVGMTVIVVGGWYFIEERINHVADEVMAEHIDRHAAIHGQLPVGIALPYIKQGQTTFPDGWGLCSPNLDKFFLVGTTNLDEVGSQIGSPAHSHSVNIETDYGIGREVGDPEAADNVPDGGINRPHKHKATGTAQEVENLPPAVQVVFLCKAEAAR